jgi:arylsulfatase A-like enzyme
MNRAFIRLIAIPIFFFLVPAHLPGQSESVGPEHRNIIIFVSDGMRAGSVNETNTPAMARLRACGVSFANSHSLFPTVTTANASAIATGHYLGDTGNFGNRIFSGYPIFQSGNFGKAAGTCTPSIENDLVLGDLDARYDGNYLNEQTLLDAARQHGFNTAVLGKVGPVAVQDASELSPIKGRFTTPQTIVLDDSTGAADGIPLNSALASALAGAGLPTATPAKVQPDGNNTTPGTTSANVRQQQYFADAATKVILPMFKKSGKPFVLFYWSSDPDGTQHNQGDSLNKLNPGINGPSSKDAARNADDNLKQILDYIHNDAELAANTDIFLTSDHGFATISKHDIDAAGHATTDYAAKWIYKDETGRQEVNTGFLPAGFLALDLAHYLKLPLFDPGSQIRGRDGSTIYEPVDPTIPKQSATVRQHPSSDGSGLIGGTGRILPQTDAKVIVAANGGSDLIYLPIYDPALLKKIVRFLAVQDYVGGIFVDDRYGNIPGALPLRAIRLKGSSKLPTPSIVVAFKTFPEDAQNPLMTAVLIADSHLQQGQGAHGSLGRDNTFNFMAAIGPDFKERFIDPSPASNADIAPTIAQILGFKLASNGELKGRVLEEALVGGPASVSFEPQVSVSGEAANGKRTILMYQKAAKQVYFDQGCFKKTANPTTAAGCP